MATALYPLSKTLDPERDYVELAEELVIVDRHFQRAGEQHPHRRFEYAMALRAQSVWIAQHGQMQRVYDVGGANSPFRYMVDSAGPVIIIDPDEPVPNSYRLDQYIAAGASVADGVFCISVLEHVDDLDQFLYHLSCLVAPGGLLFLTMDCCQTSGSVHSNGWPEDRYHFHWDRKRIFDEFQRRLLRQRFIAREFQVFGDYDERWYGPQVMDYSFCSLCMVKRS